MSECGVCRVVCHSLCCWRSHGERCTDSWQDLDQSGDEAGIKCTKRLTGHSDAVMSLQYDKDRIITGSADNTIKVWDPVTGKCLVRILYYRARARARVELIGVG